MHTDSRKNMEPVKDIKNGCLTQTQTCSNLTNTRQNTIVQILNKYYKINMWKYVVQL